jgi:hypothetical protein
MAEVEQLLSQYIAEHRSGGTADPVEYLDRLEGQDREELAALIDAYLARSPGRAWDPEAFGGSPAERLSESLARSLQGASGLWPTILPRLRDRARVKRDELVQRLADALGVSGHEDKVEVYYHQMEQGLLPSAGVSNKVLDALGGIVGASADFLRQAGRPIGEGRLSDERVVYARLAFPDERFAADEEAPAAPRSPGAPAEEWDEVDELFRGGS